MPTPELEMPTPASSTTTRSSLPHTTACSSLLQELQELWLEIGESDDMREKMAQELEQKCQDIYKEKVDETRKYRDELQRSLSEAAAEIVSRISTLGEQKGASLKDRLSIVKPLREDLKWRELYHDTLTGLTELVESRKKEKHQRLLQLQGLLRTMHELWELLETPMDERIRFGHFSSLLSQAADDVLEKGWLGLDILREVEAEVKRLNALNESQDKMKELAVSETAMQHLPEPQVPLPVEQLGSPDTQGSSSNVGDSDAVKAESFIQQVLLEIEGRKRDTGSEESRVLYDHLSRLFQSYYTLPEMEKEFRATYTTYDPRAKLPGHCFKLLLERTGGAEGGGAAAYLRRSLDFSRQRKEAEERRIEEEEIEQRRAAQPERASTEEKIRPRKGKKGRN